jgi:alkylation response protein AidB-like acyl-CoA dehydrogenase
VPYLLGFSSVEFRISNTHTIFEGTPEIQQLVIARAISGLRIE